MTNIGIVTIFFLFYYGYKYRILFFISNFEILLIKIVNHDNYNLWLFFFFKYKNIKITEI